MKLVIKILAVLVVILSAAALYFWLQRDATYYYQRASAKITKGDVTGGLADYDHAIKLKPDYAEAFIGRGSAKYRNGDWEGALADYDHATRIKPDLIPTPDLTRNSEETITNEIARQALASLETKDYSKLEDQAAKLRSSKERYADGVWMLANVYDGLVPSNLASESDWDARIQAIGKWTVARPESITARVAYANILVEYAWKARGAGKTDTVTREGSQLFGQRLIEAGRVLNDAEALKEQCPLYWRVLLRDALGLQVDKLRFDTNFDDATKAEPDCESYYYRRAIYLLPQWNGSNGEWHSDLTAR